MLGFIFERFTLLGSLLARGETLGILRGQHAYIQTYGRNGVYAHKQTHTRAIEGTAVVMMEHSEKGK